MYVNEISMVAISKKTGEVETSPFVRVMENTAIPKPHFSSLSNNATKLSQTTGKGMRQMTQK